MPSGTFSLLGERNLNSNTKDGETVDEKCSLFCLDSFNAMAILYMKDCHWGFSLSFRDFSRSYLP